MRRAGPSLIAAACLVASLVACGSEEGIGEAASAALSPHVQAVRVAAAAGERDTALARLAALRQEVAQLRGGGELSGGAAARVLEAALDVERQLMLLPAPARPGVGDGGRTTTSIDDDLDQRELEEDIRRRADEAVRKAEEDATKLAEDARKRADDARKRAKGEDD